MDSSITSRVVRQLRRVPGVRQWLEVSRAFYQADEILHARRRPTTPAV